MSEFAPTVSDNSERNRLANMVWASELQTLPVKLPEAVEPELVTEAEIPEAIGSIAVSYAMHEEARKAAQLGDVALTIFSSGMFANEDGRQFMPRAVKLPLEATVNGSPVEQQPMQQSAYALAA